jgi:SNF2 family DNA or RNA helicase
VALGEENGLEVVGRWNRGEIPLLLAHRASAGHGLNLQHGGHIVVQYGLTHDLELYLQFNKRLHRAGQKRAVFNHHIVAEKTVDEIVWPLFLKPKSNLQNRVLEAVRVRLDEQA